MLQNVTTAQHIPSQQATLYMSSGLPVWLSACGRYNRLKSAALVACSVHRQRLYKGSWKVLEGGTAQALLLLSVGHLQTGSTLTTGTLCPGCCLPV